RDDDARRRPPTELPEPGLVRRVANLELGDPRADGVHLGPRGHAALLETPKHETRRLLRVVDGADVALLDSPDLGAEPRRLGQPAPELRDPRLGPTRHRRSAIAQLLDGSDQEPPLGGRADLHVPREGAAGDPRIRPPL